MQLFGSLQDAQFKHAWLSVGAFDGVHLGHQSILKNLVAGAHADGAPAVALSFFPHPAEVLRGPLESYYLNSPEDKSTLIEALGVDALITHPFDAEFSKTTARNLVAQLKQHLGLQQLWIGEDFALGHNREGDVDKLRELGKELGFTVKVVAPVMAGGEVVSSSRIRRLLWDGEVKAAGRLLGRSYALSGEVVEGAGRGVSIGIPTANLKLWSKLAVPATGVYVCWAELRGKRWGAVANIGVRPTFGDQLEAPVVEALLLDYKGDAFYGEQLRLEFLTRLRGEQKFESVEALLAQIDKDKRRAREFLSMQA
jgi:riboflavin kinase/FMN adenylyltransferase